MGMMLRRHKRKQVEETQSVETQSVEKPKKAPVKRKKADDNGKD